MHRRPVRRVLTRFVPGRLVFLCAIAISSVLVTSRSSSAHGRTDGPPVDEAQRFAYDNALPIETPMFRATRWARPYAAGPVRVLFFTAQHPDVNRLPNRFAVELMHRFDIEGSAVRVQMGKGSAYAIAYAGGAGIVGEAAGLQRLDRLMKETFDGYVFARSSLLGLIPAATRREILERVRGGAGLVVLDKEEEKSLKEVLMMDASPAILDGTDMAAGVLGEGRVLRGAPAEVAESTAADKLAFYLAFDQRYEKLGRALFWAAKKEPEDRISMAIGKSSSSWREIAGRKIRVEAPAGLALRVRLRSSTGGDAILQRAAGTNDYVLPPMGAGRYFIDAIATGGRGVEEWVTAELQITSNASVDAIELDKTWGEVGETLSGSVQLSSPAENRVLRVQVLDKHGRILWRKDEPTTVRPVVFSVPIRKEMPAHAYLRAVLMEGGREISSAMTRFTVPHRKHDAWNMVLWGRMYAGPENVIWAEETMARHGITSRIETSAVPWWYMTNAGMNFVAWPQSGLQRQDWNGDGTLPSRGRTTTGIEVPEEACWNHEPAVTERLRHWIQEARDSWGGRHDFWPHGVHAYSMGDENETLGSCLSDSCWSAYLAFLEEQYGDIAALNASWGTAFEDLHQIQPRIDKTALPWTPEPGRTKWQRTKANLESSSLGPGAGSTAWNKSWKSYPRWFDRRAFQAASFARYVRKFGDVAREKDPQAKAGAEGTLWLDDDIDLVVRNSDWWILYSIPAAEVVRSIVPRDYRYGFWTGGFWPGFLRGANCMGVWRVDRFLAPHGEPGIYYQWMADQGRIVFDGLGQLLNVDARTEMQHDGIAMLHSFASAQAATHLPEPGSTYGTYGGWMTGEDTEIKGKRIDWALEPGGKNHVSWHRAIRALGLQFEYVTDRMLRRDAFHPEDYKVLILSQCEAIGPDEARVIRDFVRGGGAVIADVRPGLYDERCKPLKAGALDDVFGVRHTANVGAVAVPGRIHGALGGRNVTAEIADARVNPAVEVTTGTALGQAGDSPICILNRFGKGRAILLNFTMNSFPNLSLPQTEEAAADFLDALFASTGVQWPVRMVDGEGRRMRNLEAVRWKTGDDLEVVAFYAPLDRGRHLIYPDHYRGGDCWTDRTNPSAGASVRIVLPRARHITEIGAVRDPEPATTFTIHLRPRIPSFVVLSDRPLRSPVLKPATSAGERGEALVMQVGIPDAQGLHALTIRATGPDGRTAPWFDRTVMIDGQGAEIRLPLAHNEQTGAWTVEATDLYTSRKAVAKFHVE